MAKVEGLHLRASRWYVRIIVPKDLKEAYGKDRLTLALGTSDRKEAVHLATVKRAEWLTAFEAKRKELAPGKVDSISPELAQHLAERIYARTLRQDDQIRQMPEILNEVAFILGIDKSAPRLFDPPETRPPRDNLDGLNDTEFTALVRLSKGFAQGASSAAARRRLNAVVPDMEQEARELGLTYTLDTPGAKEALALCLRARQEAWASILERNEGKAIPTPTPSPAPVGIPSPATVTPKTIRDVFDRWKASGATPRSKDSIAAYARAVTQFEGQHPTKPLTAFNGDLGDQYRSWLLESCNTPKTARDRLTAIKSLLKYATETLEWLPKQPWRGLDIKAPTTNKRRPWSVSELQHFFASPLFQQGTLPEHPFAGREAAYWVPLLGLFTGARLGELCQLRAVDVQTVEGIPVLVLTDDGEDQSIKSEAGHRSVPIHSELLRLGFMEYVETIKASGADSLWPAMRLRKDKPSDFFGRWFREARESLALKPSFHYFRHTVRPLMRQAGFSEETQDKVTGHRAKGSVGTVVYGHWTLKEIRAAVEAIQYPALCLPRVVF